MGKSFWTFRSVAGDGAETRVSVDTYWDANEAIVQYIVTTPDGAMSVVNDKAPLSVRRDVYGSNGRAPRIREVHVGDPLDMKSGYSDRSIKNAVEDWASRNMPVERGPVSVKSVSR